MWGRDADWISFLSFPIGSCRGSVLVICAKMCESKAYSRTEKTIDFSSEANLSRCREGIREVWNPPRLNPSMLRNTNPGALFTNTALRRITVCFEFQRQHLNRNRASPEESVNNQRQTVHSFTASLSYHHHTQIHSRCHTPCILQASLGL